MKRLIVLSAASFAFVAGSAWAGGCVYGQKAAMASAADANEEPIASEAEELSPELLALRKLLTEDASLDEAFVLPQNVPN